MKPCILTVIGESVTLRKRGKEYVGLCPFHADKNPSLSVNEEKGLFHCFACGAGGTAVDFIMLLEGIPFKEAVRRLGVQDYHPSVDQLRHRNEAKKIAWWARATSNRVRDVLREIGDKIRVCSLARKQPSVDKKFISEHEAALVREWAILCDLDDDLNEPTAAIRLWQQRDDIDRLVESVG